MPLTQSATMSMTPRHLRIDGMNAPVRPMISLHRPNPFFRPLLEVGFVPVVWSHNVEWVGQSPEIGATFE